MLGDTDSTSGAAEAYSDPVGFGGQYGYQTDAESGLSLLGHRYYDPKAGRFLSRDPMGYGGGLDLYAYADGNPVNGADPSGYFDSPIDGALDIGALGFDGFKLGWDHFHHASRGEVMLDMTALGMDGLGALPGPPGGLSIAARIGGEGALRLAAAAAHAKDAARMGGTLAKPIQVMMAAGSGGGRRPGSEIQTAGDAWEEAVIARSGGVKKEVFADIDGERVTQDVDSVTENELIDAKDINPGNLRNFKSSNKDQLRRYITLGKALGMRPVYWFKVEPLPEIRQYLQQKGVTVRVGL